MVLIQHFEADFLWKVSLKILNSGIILKTFTHALIAFCSFFVQSVKVINSTISFTWLFMFWLRDKEINF